MGCLESATLPADWRVEPGRRVGDPIQLRYKRQDGPWCVYEILEGFNGRPAEAVTSINPTSGYSDDHILLNALMKHLGRSVYGGSAGDKVWTIVRSVKEGWNDEDVDDVEDFSFVKIHETFAYRIARGGDRAIPSEIVEFCRNVEEELVSTAVAELKRVAETFGVSYDLSAVRGWENILFRKDGGEVYLNDMDPNDWTSFPDRTVIDDDTAQMWKARLMELPIIVNDSVICGSRTKAASKKAEPPTVDMDEETILGYL